MSGPNNRLRGNILLLFGFGYTAIALFFLTVLFKESCTYAPETKEITSCTKTSAMEAYELIKEAFLMLLAGSLTICKDLID